MYEAARADPNDEGSVRRLAATAAAYGFDGLVVRNANEGRLSSAIGPAADAAGVDVVDGAAVTASDPHGASGAVGNVRTEHSIVIVRGGSPSMNRFAVENEKVDVLSKPMAGEGDFNHVLAKSAAENGVRVEFDLGPALRTTGGRRVRALQGLRKLRELVDYYEAPHVVSATPADRLELRAPRDVCALGEQLGLPASWIEEGLVEWGRLAARNRRIGSDSFIEPGVERGPYEEDG